MHNVQSILMHTVQSIFTQTGFLSKPYFKINQFKPEVYATNICTSPNIDIAEYCKPLVDCSRISHFACDCSIYFPKAFVDACIVISLLIGKSGTCNLLSLITRHHHSCIIYVTARFATQPVSIPVHVIDCVVVFVCYYKCGFYTVCFSSIRMKT